MDISEFVIINGLIIDGKNEPPFPGALYIRDGRIARVERRPNPCPEESGIPVTGMPEKDYEPDADLKTYFEALSETKRTVNTGMLIGNGTVRACVAGYHAGRRDSSKRTPRRSAVRRSAWGESRTRLRTGV